MRGHPDSDPDLFAHGIIREHGPTLIRVPEQVWVCDDEPVSTPRDQRLVRSLAREQTSRSWWRALFGAALLAVAILLVIRREGAEDSWPWVIPAIVFLAGAILVWSPLEGAVDADARRPDVAVLFDRAVWARTLVGLGLAAAAMWWFAQWPFTNNDLVRAITVPLVLVVAVALLVAPWWLRLIRQVSVERDSRIREYERAEIAAHLHDSVLQTLTLIRAKSHDPETVARLARAQERDLRTYLYTTRRSASESVATALTNALNEVEDSTGAAIEVVTVGDAPTSPALLAAVKATREAAFNAARYGVGPLSVYAELTPHEFGVFVRDGGPGFDPEAVTPDRQGIRNSIVGRVTRHGGRASVTSAVGQRTEVHITMPRGES